MNIINYPLNYYIKKLEKYIKLESTNIYDADDIIVSGLTYNSKEVEENTLFVCKGRNFKVEYLEEAISKGAIAYVSEKNYDLENDIPHIVVKDVQKIMAPLARIFYNNPQEKLKIIGIGGTKGKTTTSYIFKAALDQYLQSKHKKRAGIISSIITYDGINRIESTNTTPEAVELTKYLANAVESGLEYFVMEVSSQALKYHRTDGIFFDIGIFLNIDEDHISPMEHPNFNDYLESKLKMFKQTKKLIVYNETSEREKVMSRAVEDADTYRTFSRESKKSDYYISKVLLKDLESSFMVTSENWQEEYNISMPGSFNIENATAVIAALDMLDIPQDYVKKALAEIKVPGRTEFYYTKDKRIVGVVDFAHNRLSSEKLYDLVNKNFKDYKIVSVLGAPGEKALGRRKEVGRVVGRNADYVYLTMEDPGYEDVTKISKEIAVYLNEYQTPYSIIEDREKAIEKAFKEVTEPTIILVTGKGHETSNNVKGVSVPYATDIYYVKKFIDKYDEINRDKN